MSLVSMVLNNIIGFTRGTDRFDSNDVWHFVHHCLMPTADIPGIMTVSNYLQMGRELGRRAAFGLPGTYVKERDNGEILVYWKFGPSGLFMAVKPLGGRGEIKTLFSPPEGKVYFDRQETVGFRVLH
jgi:hypothetical protein